MSDCDQPDLLEEAMAAKAAGISVIAMGANKEPGYKWAAYQGQVATDNHLNTWFTPSDISRTGVAVVCGAVSGNLQVLDIERDEVYAERCGRGHVKPGWPTC